MFETSSKELYCSKNNRRGAMKDARLDIYIKEEIEEERQHKGAKK